MMPRCRLLLLGLFLIPLVSHRSLWAQPASPPAPKGEFRPTRLYFVRHGETVANKTGKYNKENLNRFSDDGNRQVEELTQLLLRSGRFDVICVSPVGRAINTILPYLKRTKAIAEVWPALAECCYRKESSPLPPGKLPEGKEIRLDPTLASYFTLERSPTRRTYHPANYAQGIVQVRTLVKQINERFRGSGLSVILVGHSGNGSHMIDLLTGFEPRGILNLDNAKISVLEETPAGILRLTSLNGRKPPKARRGDPAVSASEHLAR